MNIILLILGVILIMFSIVKITISFNNKDIKDQKEIKENKSGDNYDYNEEINEEVLEVKIIEKTLDLDTEDTSENINTEEETLFRKLQETEKEKSDFKEEYIDIIDTKSDKPNMTDEIIDMYKQGLTVNEIAKRLKKGIREIEIILKINKIRE